MWRNYKLEFYYAEITQKEVENDDTNEDEGERSSSEVQKESKDNAEGNG